MAIVKPIPLSAPSVFKTLGVGGLCFILYIPLVSHLFLLYSTSRIIAQGGRLMQLKICLSKYQRCSLYSPGNPRIALIFSFYINFIIKRFSCLITLQIFGENSKHALVVMWSHTTKMWGDKDIGKIP